MAKHNSGAPVEDRARERQVILGAVRLAVKQGIDVELTLKVFTAQIEANKVAQRAFLAKWKGLPAFDAVPNLATQVRPELDRLTPLIVGGLRHIPSASKFSSLAPSDPLLKEAWRVAIQPFVTPQPHNGKSKSFY